MRRTILLVLFAGLCVRLLLLAFGREIVVDGFYLQAAWLLGRGEAPYVSFPMVSFPLPEALYAFLLVPFRSLLTASVVTGAAHVATALLIALTAASAAGRRAGAVGGLLYLFAAPLIAFHTFEREVWSALGLAGSLLVMLRRPDARLAGPGIGACLAAAMLCKLTAAVGALAVLVELVLRRRTRHAVEAAAVCGLVLAAAASLLYAFAGDTGIHQVFLFFFFKGGDAPMSERGLTLLRHLDPTLALGIAAVFVLRLSRRARPAVLLLLAWILYYGLSPSLWDHNLIDLALPAAFAGGALVRRARRKLDARIGCAAAGLVWIALVIAGAAQDSGLRPAWYPHGFGGSFSGRIRSQAELLAAHSGSDDLVLAPTPTSCLVAGRRSFVFDFELTPVALALTEEIRRRGLFAALDGRSTRVALGSARDPDVQSADLFTARRDAAVVLHVIPRVLDALESGEIALVLDPTPPPIAETLERLGFAPVGGPGCSAWVAPELRRPPEAPR